MKIIYAVKTVGYLIGRVIVSKDATLKTKILGIAAAAIMALFSTGCATSLSDHEVTKFLYNDIQAAAQYADKAGYPERAAIHRAIGARVKACLDALEDALQKLPEIPDGAGIITLYEIGRITAASVNFQSPRIKLLCAAIPTNIMR